MTRAALFVDLSNFYGSLLNSYPSDQRDAVKQYFLEWLDLDLLARSLCDSFQGIWVFYSSRRIGPSRYRLSQQETPAYIKRINSLMGVTARDVDIASANRQSTTAECPHCHKDFDNTYFGEKGVDSSLIVHLFDTMDAWDEAFLLSGDADYVPAVASLRRRGKIVIGAGFEDASSALRQECYHYLDLRDQYISADVELFRLFALLKAGEKWFTDDLVPTDKHDRQKEVTAYVRWWLHVPDMGENEVGNLSFSLEKDVDLSSRHQWFIHLAKSRPQVTLATRVRGCSLDLEYPFSLVLDRKIETIVPDLDGMQYESDRHGMRTWQRKYQYHEETGCYVPLVSIT